MLAQQLKSLLPFIAQYEKQIAELFGSHPDSFLFDNLPGAGPGARSTIIDRLRHGPRPFRGRERRVEFKRHCARTGRQRQAL
jgi:hypothetical protein